MVFRNLACPPYISFQLTQYSDQTIRYPRIAQLLDAINNLWLSTTNMFLMRGKEGLYLVFVDNVITCYKGFSAAKICYYLISMSDFCS